MVKIKLILFFYFICLIFQFILIFDDLYFELGLILGLDCWIQLFMCDCGSVEGEGEAVDIVRGCCWRGGNCCAFGCVVCWLCYDSIEEDFLLNLQDYHDNSPNFPQQQPPYISPLSSSSAQTNSLIYLPIHSLIFSLSYVL